ncbi:fumarylacetoacetase [Apiospora marii]|uniref:fumarylacetoacetase n=1 Tax=Apiospora marii TaxID=335849 RepID=UPI00312F40E8
MKFSRINNTIVRIVDPSKKDDPMPAHMTHCAATLLEVLKNNKPNQSDPRKRDLPFQPLSYRDFMLFPAHYAGAAAGIAALWLQQTRIPFLGTLLAWLAWFWHWATGSRQPIFYQGNHLSIVASGTPVAKPHYCARYLDVELELGVLYNAGSPNEALGAVAGLCVLNDFSARDVQWPEMRSGFGPQLCKSFASAISSEVVSYDEVYLLLPVNSAHSIAQPQNVEGKHSMTGNITPLKGRVTVNGKVVAECAVAHDDWQFTLGEALMYASQSTRLYPGELFGSGTFPRGAGIEYLSWSVKVGDTVTLEIDGVGSVTNTIVEEPQFGRH